MPGIVALYLALTLRAWRRFSQLKGLRRLRLISSTRAPPSALIGTFELVGIIQEFPFLDELVAMTEYDGDGDGAATNDGAEV